MDVLSYSSWFVTLLSLLHRLVFAPSPYVNLQLSWLTNTADLGDHDKLELLDLQSLRHHRNSDASTPRVDRTKAKKTTASKKAGPKHTK